MLKNITLVFSKDKIMFQDMMNYDGNKNFININVLMKIEMYYYLK
jgi:hypothetical protein